MNISRTTENEVYILCLIFLIGFLWFIINAHWFYSLNRAHPVFCNIDFLYSLTTLALIKFFFLVFFNYGVQWYLLRDFEYQIMVFFRFLVFVDACLPHLKEEFEPRCSAPNYVCRVCPDTQLKRILPSQPQLTFAIS